MAIATSRAGAQDSVLTQLLIANRHSVSLADGRLMGAGGRLLVDEGKRSRFFLVGEEHGVAEIPAVVQALLARLRPAGYNTFAIEVSPLQAHRLDSIARRPGAGAALDTLLSSWMTAIPFYTLTPERDLLASAMSRLGRLPPLRIWGLDYDVTGDRFYLRELERLVPPSGRGAVRRAREQADSGFALLMSQGNPSRLFAWSATDSAFAALRAALGPRPSTRAREIVAVFERTARINRLFLGGRAYESNLDRSAFLRQNFAVSLAGVEAARTPARVLFKFGGSHVMRGMNYTHTLDLGTAAAIVAEARGERSFHVLMLGGPGSRNTRMNIVKAQYEPIGTAEIDDQNLAWLRPALPDSGWVVFDLRPVRTSYVRQRAQQLTPIQDRFLHAYDAILVVLRSTPSPSQPIAGR